MLFVLDAISKLVVAVSLGRGKYHKVATYHVRFANNQGVKLSLLGKAAVRNQRIVSLLQARLSSFITAEKTSLTSVPPIPSAFSFTIYSLYLLLLPDNSSGINAKHGG